VSASGVPIPNTRGLRVASYNIHRCIGSDRERNPLRIAGILRELEVDLVGLQEVESRTDGGADTHQLNYLAGMTGMQPVAGPTVLRPDSQYGNAVLTRLPVLAIRRLDLSVRGCEPRGAVDVDVEGPGGTVRVIATHLGLRPWERRRQVARLLEALRHPRRERVILLGDINEWVPGSRAVRRLHREFGRAPGIRTFPARFPLLALDRIWSRPRGERRSIARYESTAARVASDHLPLRAVMGPCGAAREGSGPRDVPPAVEAPFPVSPGA